MQCDSTRALVALSLVLGAGCARTSDLAADSSLRVEFEVERGTERVPCSTFDEIEDVQINAYTPDHLTKLAGFPVSAECADGEVELPKLPSGEHIIQVAALGTLAGEPGAVLFSAEARVTTPSAVPLSITLQPQVADLTVGWVFEDLGLNPCASEVEDVEVLLSAGGRANVSQRFRCADTPAVIPMLLPAASFTVEVDAYSPEDFILFSATERRTFARGHNELVATLAAQGGRVLLDWSFQIDGQAIRPCDDPRVDVREPMIATVREVSGFVAATEMFSCAEVRPHAFRASRYQAGHELEVALVAQGARDRFRGVERFIMPERDRLIDPPLVLEAVGSATVAFSFGRPECEALVLSGFRVQLFDVVGQGQPLERLTRQLPGAARVTRFEDLPYGEYEVRIEAQVEGQAVCSVEGRRVIAAPDNVWEPFVL